MSYPKIDTPRGEITYIKTKNGKVTAKLTWNEGFQREKQQQFNKAQQFVDNEVLRLSDRYIPKRTGALIKSGVLGTVIGHGEVKYIAPYSRAVYYNKSAHFQDAPTRQAFWFEFMKKRHLDGIKKGVKKKFG